MEGYHLINHCFETPKFSFSLYGNTRTKSTFVVCRIWESQDWGPGASSSHPLLSGARSQSHWVQGSRGPRASARALVCRVGARPSGGQSQLPRQLWAQGILGQLCLLGGEAVSLPASCLTWGVPVVQLSSHVQLFATPWTAARQASLSLTISRSLPKFIFIASVMPSSHLILWCLFSFWTLRCPRTSAKRLVGGIRSPGTVKLEGGFQTATYQHRCPQTPVSVSQGKLQLPPASPGSSPRSAGGSDQQTGPRVCAL